MFRYSFALIPFLISGDTVESSQDLKACLKTDDDAANCKPSRSANGTTTAQCFSICYQSNDVKKPWECLIIWCTFGADRFAGIFHSALARAGYRHWRGRQFAERSSVGPFGDCLNLWQHGDWLRGQGSGLIRLGDHFSLVYLRYHEYSYRCAQVPSTYLPGGGVTPFPRARNIDRLRLHTCPLYDLI